MSFPTLNLIYKDYEEQYDHPLWKEYLKRE